MSLGHTDSELQIDNPAHLSLAPEEITVLKLTFSSYERVTIKEEFGGGLSGSRVLLIRPIRSKNRPELPTVVKIAPANLIRREWQAYQEHVHNKLPRIAKITGEPVFVPNGLWGGLRYTLAGASGTFEIESLHRYCERASISDIRYILEDRLFKVIGASWWQFSQAVADWPLHASYDPLLPVNLLIQPATIPSDVTPYLLKPGTSLNGSPSRGDFVRIDGFEVTEVNVDTKAVTLNCPSRGDDHVESYRLRLQPVESVERYQVGDIIAPIDGRVSQTRHDLLDAIVQEVFERSIDLTGDALTSASGTVLPNPLANLRALLGTRRDIRMSLIHGDLNLENILVEPASRNISLIDFATARRDHALHDLLRLETEVMTKPFPAALATTDQLEETIYAFYQQLHEAISVPEAPFSLQPSIAELEKPFEMIVCIRRMARQCLFDQEDWKEYYLGLTLYLLGALKFKNLDRLPKQVAFWAAAAAFDLLQHSSLDGTPAIIDWEPMKKYLPAEMYQERHRPTCLEHLNQLIRTVATYLPRHLALELLQEPTLAENKGQFLEGTLLFADISGFTNLSEKLKETTDKAGAEILVNLINWHFNVMLEVIFKHDGRLTNFGGDAMLCLFLGKEQGAKSAVLAAWEMRQELHDRFDEGAVLGEIVSLDERELLLEMLPLEIRIGINSGLFFAANVGTPEHMEYVLTGSAVQGTAQAESAGHKGEIIVSRRTLDLVGEILDAEQLDAESELFRVKTVHELPLEEVEDSWDTIDDLLSALSGNLSGLVSRLDVLAPYLPSGVLTQLVYDVQGGQVTGQHRRVTILFANFIGMDKVIHARGSDEPNTIAADLGDFFKTMQEEIRYYGGMINKVDLHDQGDKLMVIFGAPLAHEKDAHRTALAALKMQEAMHKLSFPTARFLSLRIGINTGTVFAGNVGSSQFRRREYTVIGDDVNLAARLMSVAENGQILVSQSVWDQIQGDFEARELALVRLKGKRDPVRPFLLLSAQLQEDRTPRVIHSEIVGRDTELAELQKRYRGVQFRKRKQIVAITGDAGIGKTRLVQEWRTWSQTAVKGGREVTWLIGRGRPYAKESHGVFVQILEQLLAFADDDPPDKRWNKLSEQLEGLFPELGPAQFDAYLDKMAYLGRFLALDLSRIEGLTARVERLDDRSRQIQMRLAACDLIEYAAQDRSLILILEDFHWADIASHDMLEFVWNRIKHRTPILFCLIHRPQVDHPTHPIWQQVIPPDCEIALKELREQDNSLLLFSLLQTRQLPKAFQDLILKEAGGNPLYAEEVLRAMIEDGVIVRQNGAGWQLARSAEEIHVPDALLQIIQSSIDTLDFRSPGARRALWMAAVIGEELTEDLWLHLFTHTGRQEDEFWAHLEALRGADLIREFDVGDEDRPRWVYRFRHGLVHKVAYDSMLVSNRCAYHLEIGHWLEKTYSEDLQRHYTILANEYDKGRHWEKAFKYHHLAGEKEARSFANQEAAFHLRRATEIARNITPETDTLARVHFELGKVLATAGEFDAAIENLQRAFGSFAGSALRARVCYHIGRIFERRGGSENLERALEWQSKGLNLLPNEPTAEAALLHVLGGAIGVRQGDVDRVLKEGRRALALAEATATRSELATAHRTLSVAYRAHGRFDLAAEHCQQGIEVDQKLSNLVALATDYSNQGTIALDVGNWALAVEADLKAIDILERIGEKFELARTLCNLADKYRCLGELEAGIDYARQGLAIFSQLESPQGTIFAHLVLAILLWRKKDLDQARDELLETRELVEQYNVAQFKPDIGRWLAQVYLTEGNLKLAQAEIEPLLSLTQEEVGVEYEAVRRVWGQVLAAQGNLILAAQELHESLERLEQSQALYETAGTLLALAGALIQMDSRGEEARTYAERARVIFADLGARLDLEEADALLARIE